jgi:hypothetical protein
MTKYPDVLEPTSQEVVNIGFNQKICVLKTTPTFTPWIGKPIDDDYNGKQVLDIHGRPAFAELAILWAMQAENWDGVWIDTYRRKYRKGYWGVPPLADLPSAPSKTLEKIYSRVGSRSGAWDVYCWKGKKILFIEAKRMNKDSIRETQRRFLKAGIDVGLTPENYLVVEWNLK